MQFLQSRPVVALADTYGTTYESFVAEVFTGRPPFQEIQSYVGVVADLQTRFEATLPRSAYTSMAMYMDTAGLFLVVTSRREMTTGNAKQAVDLFLRALPAEQRRHAKSTFHPLDELDLERIDAMETVLECRPGEDNEEWISPLGEDEDAPLPLSLRPSWRLADLEALVDTHTRTNSIGVLLPALEDAVPTDDQLVLALRGDVGAHRVLWGGEVQRRAAILVAKAGEQPLTYVRCYTEDRREALIAKRLGERPNLVAVVKIAATMAENGQLPKAVTVLQKSRFIDRCRRVLLKRDASVVTVVKQLPPQQQNEIALALDDTKRFCRCTKSARVAITDAEWSNMWWRDSDDLALPERAEANGFYCSMECVDRPIACVQCGKDDSLAYDSTKPLPVHDLGYSLLIPAIQCTRCNKSVRAQKSVQEVRAWCVSQSHPAKGMVS